MAGANSVLSSGQAWGLGSHLEPKELMDGQIQAFLGGQLMVQLNINIIKGHDAEYMQGSRGM